ncbi:type III secretion system inner membrane ring subunit SctD [Ottowia thiooxydans]|uniref:type III secretion system inner membrane ring subunit SctD n=1 Tax=Ottowia thiooxydans TaxID=219182 RepID=UPI0004179981|nr:type III secretion system inner membrane ring subunit SctD [Ottowia thiooxydans]
MRDSLALELRVLNGRHAGASTAARDGLLLGAVDESDVILTDLDPRAGVARLHLLDGQHWLLTPADEHPTEHAWDNAPKVGELIHWGGLALCVSAPHTDWPPLPVTYASSGFEPEQSVAHVGAEPDSLEPSPVEHVQKTELDGALGASLDQPRRSKLRSSLWIAAAVFLILGLLVLAAFVSDRPSLKTEGATELTVPSAPDMTAQAQKQMPDLALAIAKLDSTLRLQLTPQRDGLVRVNGWVETVAQLDRLADALGMRRPAPVMRVHVATDVRTELRAQLAGSYPQLDFLPGGPGVLRIRGIVPSAAAQHEALTAVGQLLPARLELADELSLAEKLAPEVRAALVTAGFADAKASWDGHQVLATLSLKDLSRARFEDTLVELAKRFPGLPLRVNPTLVTPVIPAIQSARSKAPFPILGVVGGEVPYVVLPGGGKLLPGGSHEGWRLQAIDPDVLVFDSPRRLVVTR